MERSRRLFSLKDHTKDRTIEFHNGTKINKGSVAIDVD